MLAPNPPAYTPRQRAVLPGGSVDRWIGPLKAVLPWAAGLGLAAVLALSLPNSKEFSFVLKRDQVMTSKERLRIERAVYRGTDAKGRPFTVRADQAVQRTAAVAVVDVRGIDATMKLASGPARITAASGAYDIEHDRMTLAGPVHAVEGGYALTTGRATLDIDKQTVASDGPVTGRSRLGNFTANQMNADVSGQTVVLSGGARLHIDRRAAN
jgi:lipopolysaccharide export system protein LptC